jgi:hypothetical protein
MKTKFIKTFLEDFIPPDADGFYIEGNENSYSFYENVDPFFLKKGEYKGYSYEIKFGTTKAVIIFKDLNYVIKIPVAGVYRFYPHQDKSFLNSLKVESSLAREEDLYRDSHAAKAFLLKNIYLGEINNIPIYIQKKVDHFYSEPAQHIKSPYLDSICKELPLSFKLDIVSFYKKGEEILEELYWLGDIHDENIGYIGSRPVCLDYGW